MIETALFLLAQALGTIAMGALLAIGFAIGNSIVNSMSQALVPVPA